jgi:hypothetical protein
MENHLFAFFCVAGLFGACVGSVICGKWSGILQEFR